MSFMDVSEMTDIQKQLIRDYGFLKTTLRFRLIKKSDSPQLLSIFLDKKTLRF